MFERYVGIDYSGAETADSSLKGLCVYEASLSSAPREVPPPSSPRKYWNRRGLAQWLATSLATGPRTLVGIDHGFSFPLDYFDRYGIDRSWDGFLRDFCAHWPTGEPNTNVDFVREGDVGRGRERMGDRAWRRIAERRCGAKSVFHFDAQGAVAKSTHAGLPWLLYLRDARPARLHFWPFDGWELDGSKSVVVEVYPSLWSRGFRRESRNAHQQDAYSIAEWMRRFDAADWLGEYFQPQLDSAEAEVAAVEGWILGVA